MKSNLEILNEVKENLLERIVTERHSNILIAICYDTMNWTECKILANLILNSTCRNIELKEDLDTNTIFFKNNELRLDFLNTQIEIEINK